MVRNEIVKAVALDEKATAGQTMLIKALDDQEPRIVATAALGIGRHTMVQQAPKLIQLLSRDELVIRLSVARAFSALGPKARPHLSGLKLALAREQEPEARSALSAAIAATQREE